METPQTPEQPDRGPQSPAPGPQSPMPGPESPAQPHTYGGPVPPGGWQQPAATPTPWAPGAFKLAGWWSRVGAAIVDGLVIAIPALVIVAFLGVGAFASGDTGAVAFILGIVLTIFIAAIIGILYAPLLMARSGRNNGQTWGKQSTNCRVVRTDGRPFTFGSAAVREIGIKWLLFGVVGGFFASIPTIVDWLWPLWDDENRALHDYLASTRVVVAA